MSPTTIDFVRELVHLASMGLIAGIVLFAIIGTVRPRLFRRVLKEFAERKYIIGSGIFICLLCGTIFTATQSTEQSHASENNKPGVETMTKLPDTATQDQQSIEPTPTPSAPNTDGQVASTTSLPQSSNETPAQQGTVPAQPPARSAPYTPAQSQVTPTPHQPEPQKEAAQKEDRDRGPLGNLVCGLFRC